MNNKELVLVIEDPISWKTKVLDNSSGLESVTPFYTHRENPDFTEKECTIIEQASGKKPMTLLVRSDVGLDAFEYTPITDIIKSSGKSVMVTDSQFAKVVTGVLKGFFLNLGGDNIKIRCISTIAENEKGTTKMGANLDVNLPRGNGTGGIDFNGTDDADRKFIQDNTVEIGHVSPDVGRARLFLKRYHFLETQFGELLKTVESNRSAGTLYTEKLTHETVEKMVRRFSVAFDAAVNLGIYNSNVKANFDKAREECRTLKMEWEISLVLPNLKVQSAE